MLPKSGCKSIRRECKTNALACWQYEEVPGREVNHLQTGTNTSTQIRAFLRERLNSLTNMPGVIVDELQLYVCIQLLCPERSKF